MKAWPFLFSRGYVLDSQLVVCPRILKEGGRWGEFSRIVARLPSDPSGDIKIEEVENAKVGRITLIYRENYAVRNGAVARDVAGRSVPELRGLMIEGRFAAKVSAVSEAALAQAAPALDSAFEAFWDQKEETGPSFSDGFDVGAAVGRTPSIDAGPAGKKMSKVTTRQLVIAVALAALIPSTLMAGLAYWHYAATAKRLTVLEAIAKDHHETLGKLRQDVETIKSGSGPR